MSKIKKFVKWLFIAIICLILVAFIAFKIYTSMYYRTDNSIVHTVENLLDSEVNSYSDTNGSVFIPEKQDIRAVIVFYPGGKVEYTAYNSLMYELASRGFLCLLPKMPENLAILEVNASDVLTKNYKSNVDSVIGLDWYLAGHSLGGVAACTYLNNILTGKTDSDITYKGIIMCASYPTTDFSDSDIRLLSMYGSNDTVLNLENYESSKTYWPADSEEYIIEGGIHSYFGSYGIQNGDGQPTITNRQQTILAADKIEEWIR